MIENAKIQFSAEELELLKNSEWILTKNRIIEKAAAGLGQLASKVEKEMKAVYPSTKEYALYGYKVSRGEKYQGLPYLILDYPRVFGREDVFAIRVLLWWGNYFSITLHTKGRFANNIYKLLEEERPEGTGLLISSSGDEWNHNLSHVDYRPLDGRSLKNWLTETGGTGFIKISRRVDLLNWEMAEGEIYRQYHQYLQMMETSFLYDEKGL